MNLVFVYAGGRQARLADARAGRAPTEFFYGAIELAARGHPVTCLDASDGRSPAATAYNLLLGDRTPVRTRGEHLVATWRLRRELEKAEVVVATSTSHALALGFWKRLGFLRARLVGIHCGLVNHPLAGARLRSTTRALRDQEIVLFADSERARTISQFGLAAPAVQANAFGVDTKFWTPGGTPGDYVLAVGSDGRRDYATLVEAVRDLEIPVRIVTKKSLPQPLPANVTHVQGSWHAPALTDGELRELYRGARLVVVPLEDSIQPSGQSVALQAMACGRPVVLTRTRGLWTGEDFHDGRDLLLVEPGSPAALRRAMLGVLDDPARGERLGRSGLEAVSRHGRIEAFADRLEALLTTPPKN